ncbi:3-oxoacyl-ACP synthase [Sessilibacter sp. MAH1]
MQTSSKETATKETLTPHAQNCLQSLISVWLNFEKQLNRTDIIRKLNAGSLTNDDYKILLLNLRQQVIEGSRWISRAASSFDREFSDIRSIVIGHAKEEHLDYLLLEKDFEAAGGDISLIQQQPKNIGSEALHGYMMHKSSEKNPVGLIGAMWIIEGLGEKMANEWASRIDELLALPKTATKFMQYHGENDDSHMEKLYTMLNRVCIDESVIEEITTTAKVVARLYALQLEVIDYE